MGHRTFVIAEVAATHDGDSDAGIELVEMVKKAGADAVKFQWTSNPRRMADRRRMPIETYNYLNFPLDWLIEWHKVAKDQWLEFMCTVYLPEDIPIIAPLVDRFKVASLESQDRTFIDAHMGCGKPIVVSTGAMSHDELRELLSYSQLLFPSGFVGTLFRLLHCTAVYPVSIDEVNLSWIRRYGLEGFSDHTHNVITGALAVAAGASIIEVHARGWETKPTNPDYGHSLDPAQLVEYVQGIRMVEQMMGVGQKCVTKSEETLLAHRVIG